MRATVRIRLAARAGPNVASTVGPAVVRGLAYALGGGSVFEHLVALGARGRETCVLNRLPDLRVLRHAVSAFGVGPHVDDHDPVVGANDGRGDAAVLRRLAA